MSALCPSVKKPFACELYLNFNFQQASFIINLLNFAEIFLKLGLLGCFSIFLYSYICECRIAFRLCGFGIKAVADK